jgi:hypothetical protein
MADEGVLRTVSRQARPDRGPNGAGGAFRKAEYPEGSKVSGTSKEAEIKLVNVARASLEELLEDYRDFLRVRKLVLWDKDRREARFVRRLGSRENKS